MGHRSAYYACHRHKRPPVFKMRIAKPLLLVTTPIGVVLGVHEAFRLAGGLAFLMIVLLLGMSAAIGGLALTIRREEREARAREAQRTQP